MKARKPLRDDERRGVVVWNVVSNQNDEMVALYNILTLLSAKRESLVILPNQTEVSHFGMLRETHLIKWFRFEVQDTSFCFTRAVA